MKLRLPWIGVIASAPAFAIAGLAPENVAVVVNSDSWASLTVANEYARLRGIPASNFVHLKGLSSNEVIDVKDFRANVLGPVLRTMKERNLVGQIDCITYSLDIPYAVNTQADMGGRKWPQVITPVAATNGLTFLHELVMAENADYLRLDINRYHRRRLPLPKGTAFNDAELKTYAEGVSLYDAKKYRESVNVLKPLFSVARRDASACYNYACSLALAGMADDAVGALRMALNAGWRNFGQTLSDSDLKSLHPREDFQKLVTLMQTARLEMQPGVPFSASAGWDDDGAAAANGPKYMLSTFLGVTCGRGSSVQEVLDSLRRSAGADGTAPKGTIYYPKNGDVRSTTREWGFDAAARDLRPLGVNAVVEQGILPKNRTDVAGAMIGIADFDWPGSGSKMLPGAIAEHLTSLGGIISERGGQTPCTEFIRYGASGSSGTVTEPYALQEKFPNPFIHVFYVSGFTLAEAFYLSLYGPYQLLVIGDPLCKPWAKPLSISFAPTFKSGTVVKTGTAVPVIAKGAEVASFALYIDGKAAGQGLTLNTTSVAPGPHLLSVVATAKGTNANKARISIPITVGSSKVKASTSTASVSLGDPVKISVSAPGAKKTWIEHLGRALAVVEGAPNSNVILSSLDLGMGRAVLRVRTDVGLGEPVVVNVGPPALLTPAGSDNFAGKPGIGLIVGESRTVVSDTWDNNWFTSRVKQGQKFVAAGDFRTDGGLYQLHIKSNCKVTVKVSGQVVSDPRAQKLNSFVPLNLGNGTHRIEVSGVGEAGANSLELRIGGRGCFKASNANFRCPSGF